MSRPARLVKHLSSLTLYLQESCLVLVRSSLFNQTNLFITYRVLSCPSHLTEHSTTSSSSSSSAYRSTSSSTSTPPKHPPKMPGRALCYQLYGNLSPLDYMRDDASYRSTRLSRPLPPPGPSRQAQATSKASPQAEDKASSSC